MSRPLRWPRLTLAISIAIFCVVYAFAVYIFILNRRLSRELVNHSWREPTILMSNAGKTPREVAKLYGTDWRVTPPVRLEAIPPHVGYAFMAAEDVRFRFHPGVDPIGIARAALRNVRAGGIAEGGSTIDQQIIKQRYFSNERTWRRKIVEMILAVILDARLSKNDILELYLNDVYLGHFEGSPVLGVDEAARLYFDKTPRQLRPDEAAILAAIVRAPNRDNPRKRPDLVRTRRDGILNVMREHKWITEQQYRDGVARAVDLDRGRLPQTPFPFYMRAMRAEVVKEVGVGAIISGGLTIVCEVDPVAQRAAEQVASRTPASLEARYRWLREQAAQDPLQVALLSVDPRTGGVRALVGGSDFKRSTLDRTSRMHRQPGSAFKTFAFLAAISSKRATNATLLLDTPVKIAVGSEEWAPQNYDERFRGRVTLREAFEKSLNVPTVRLTQQIGMRRVVSTADKFGFEEDFKPVPALALGVTEVTMRDLTAAYTAFPNLGERVEPYLLTEVRDRRGKTLYKHKVERKRVIDRDSAFIVHTLLRGVVQRGTASRLRRYGLGYVAGKTGTTNDYRDAWFVGYTPDMVTTVWVGFDKGAPLRLSSGEAAIPVWGAYMRELPHIQKFPDAPDGVTWRQIDPETGMLWREGCPGPRREAFLDGTAPTHQCPRGIIGKMVRRVFFDEESFDEPAAITLDKFRRWANEADRNRQQVESAMDRFKRIFQ
jgi:penicillin-binding protein 1B